LDEHARSRWDDFVEECSDATFFHKSGWKHVIEKAFGHRTYFFYAQKNGRIEGVLPLGHVCSRIFGNALISTPFCVYGGVAANNNEARVALEQAAERLAVKLNVDYLELRNLKQSDSDWHTKELYVTFRKNIDPDPVINMKAIPRKQRAMVRKGIKAGLCSEIDESIDRFYKIYATSVRNHGTPVFSKRYFKLLKEVFADKCEILTVNIDGKAISSVMSFYFKDEVLPYYAGGTLEARRLKGFDFMYWDLMKNASERGIRIFDYGRSKLGTVHIVSKKIGDLSRRL
jgi:FemAB-related protein (PEP-CTERM system-associated)